MCKACLLLADVAGPEGSGSPGDAPGNHGRAGLLDTRHISCGKNAGNTGLSKLIHYRMNAAFFGVI